MKRIEHCGLQYYQSSLLNGTQHGIFTRHGGVSETPFAALNTGGTVGDDVRAVHRNHQLMYDALGVNAAMACTTWLIHSADVVVANRPIPKRRWVARADGLITNRRDVPLVMRYADCVPLLFYDPVVSAIGIAHAGWRGTVQGVAYNTVVALQNAYGSDPRDVRVVIGPSISPQCFQVGEEVVTAVAAHFGTLEGLMQRDPADQTAYVDLWTANQRDLERAGVLPQHIDLAAICTHQNTVDFYSHRAEQGKTGRFGVVISL